VAFCKGPADGGLQPPRKIRQLLRAERRANGEGAGRQPHPHARHAVIVLVDLDAGEGRGRGPEGAVAGRTRSPDFARRLETWKAISTPTKSSPRKIGAGNAPMANRNAVMSRLKMRKTLRMTINPRFDIDR
jgi:hypothetical protein